MTKLDRIQATGGRARRRRAISIRKPRRSSHYYAFLSYCHDDDALAESIHDQLEQFRVPSALVGKITDNGAVPKRLTPIFRDRHELGAATDLGAEIRSALATSQYLVVLCTPAAARSQWVNAEIDAFKRSRPNGCVLAVIGDGEPFASEIDGRSDEECFPPALRVKYDGRGRPTGRKAEPLAADLRGGPDNRRTGFLKLVAGMLGVGLDDLVQRDTVRRQRRLAWLSAASLAGMVVTSGLAITAIQARDAARDQRREAEGLIAFMVGDLKDKIVPVGKLSALDGVGSKVLDYYRGQDTSQLTDTALMQRSQALSMTAQAAYSGGNLENARRLYQEASAGTAEAIARNPNDPERLFEHSQNVFYIGNIASDRSDLATAERAFREYSRLARQMEVLQPDNLKWKMEAQYAATNLGFVFLKQRRFVDAARQFAKAHLTIEAIAAIDSTNAEYQKSLAQSLAWLADAQLARGNVAASINARRRQIAVLKALAARSSDVAVQEQLIPAQQTLGNLLLAVGLEKQSSTELKAAVTTAEQLIPAEPGNSEWTAFAGSAQFSLALQYLVARQPTEAAPHVARGCAYADTLKRLNGAAIWQQLQRTCLSRQAQLALAQRDPANAISNSGKAVAIAQSVRSSDPVKDRYTLARALLLNGDSYRAAGNDSDARQAWARGLALTNNANEQPGESGVRAELLDRIGERSAATRIRGSLLARGIRNPMIL